MLRAYFRALVDVRAVLGDHKAHLLPRVKLLHRLDRHAIVGRREGRVVAISFWARVQVTRLIRTLRACPDPLKVVPVVVEHRVLHLTPPVPRRRKRDGARDAREIHLFQLVHERLALGAHGVVLFDGSVDTSREGVHGVVGIRDV